MLKPTILILAVTCVFVVGNVAGLSAANLKEDDLQTLIEKLLVKLKSIVQGNDPFNYGGSSSSSNSYGTIFNGSISNMIISGQSTMNVTHLKVVEADPKINFSLGLTFNGLMLTGNYGLYLDMLTLAKLYGSGELGAKAALFGINVTSLITQDASANNTLQFEELTIDVEVPQLKIDVKNLLNRPGLSTYANQILNDLLPTLLSEDERVQGLISSYAKSKLNPLMTRHQVNLALVRDFINHLIN